MMIFLFCSTSTRLLQRKEDRENEKKQVKKLMCITIKLYLQTFQKGTGNYNNVLHKCSFDY